MIISVEGNVLGEVEAGVDVHFQATNEQPGHLRDWGGLKWTNLGVNIIDWWEARNYRFLRFVVDGKASDNVLDLGVLRA